MHYMRIEANASETPKIQNYNIFTNSQRVIYATIGFFRHGALYVPYSMVCSILPFSFMRHPCLRAH